jgi:GGDEF domain-containing protein
MAATVAGVTFLILCGTLALSILDARNQSRTAQMASSLHEANAQLQHLALHDTLTRLPNRLLLEDRAQQVIEECRRSGDQCAVLLVGLDRFKTLNDSLGHFAGDTVLRTVAARLRSAVRAEDTVARLGGDEFASRAPSSGACRSRSSSTGRTCASARASAWAFSRSTATAHRGSSPTPMGRSRR